MRIISIERICFCSLKSRLICEVQNSKQEKFGVTTDTKMYLVDKEADIEEILTFFRKQYRVIAEIETEDYHLKYINFLPLE